MNTISERLKARYFFICRYFSFYGQLKFRAQLSWAWKKFYNLGAWSPDAPFLIVNCLWLHSWQSLSDSFFHVSLGLPTCMSHAVLTAPLECLTSPNQQSLLSQMRSRPSSFDSSLLDSTVATSSGLIRQICLIMALSLHCRFILVNAQVSLARIMHTRSVPIMSWPQVLKEMWRDVSTGSSSLVFFQFSHKTVVTASSQSLPVKSMSPRKQKEDTTTSLSDFMTSFHINSFLTHSSRESAMMTRSSAYRSSQGTLDWNSHDKGTSTKMKSKGLSTNSWWTPTSTSNFWLWLSPIWTWFCALAYIPWTNRTIHSSTPSFRRAHQITVRGSL